MVTACTGTCLPFLSLTSIWAYTRSGYFRPVASSKSRIRKIREPFAGKSATNTNSSVWRSPFRSSNWLGISCPFSAVTTAERTAKPGSASRKSMTTGASVRFLFQLFRTVMEKLFVPVKLSYRTYGANAGIFSRISSAANRATCRAPALFRWVLSSRPSGIKGCVPGDTHTNHEREALSPATFKHSVVLLFRSISTVCVSSAAAFVAGIHSPWVSVNVSAWNIRRAMGVNNTGIPPFSRVSRMYFFRFSLNAPCGSLYRAESSLFSSLCPNWINT